MIKYRKLEEQDLECMMTSKRLKALLQFEPTEKQLFCFLGEEDGEIVTGLSGVYNQQTAEIQSLVLAPNEPNVLKEGLVRSTIHMLERMGIVLLETKIQDDVFSRIGFKNIDDGVKQINTVEFFAQSGCCDAR